VARGELPADADLDVLVDRLVGPLSYRIPVTAEFGAELVTGCTPGPSGRS